MRYFVDKQEVSEGEFNEAIAAAAVIAGESEGLYGYRDLFGMITNMIEYAYDLSKRVFDGEVVNIGGFEFFVELDAASNAS